MNGSKTTYNDLFLQGQVSWEPDLWGNIRRQVESQRATAQATAADLANVDAFPSTPAGKDRYAHFLTLPKPRAFVVYEDGGWRFFAKDPEAMTKALDLCARQGKRCWLYAADDRVVWSADVDKRIGASSQLGGGNAPVDPKDEHQ